MPSGAIDQAICQVRLVSLIYGRGTRGAPQVDPQRYSQALFGTFLLRTHVLFFQISYYSNYYSCVCFILLFHSCCSHARGILCGILTSCMGSPFPIVNAEWSHVFWSFRIMLCRVEKDCFKLTNNNNIYIFTLLFAIRVFPEPQFRLQVILDSQSNLRQGDSRPSGSSTVRSLALVLSCLGLFPFVPKFLQVITVILVPSCFVLALHERMVSCEGYTSRAWGLYSLQSVLNGPLYFDLLGSCFAARKRTALS